MKISEDKFIELKSIPAVVFKTEKAWYIYDRFSNLILKTNKLIADLIDEMLSGISLRDIHEKHKYYSFEDLVNAAKEIDNIKQNNILVDYQIQKLSICNEDDKKKFLERKLDGLLTQLILNVTEGCNLRCEYCIYSGSYLGKRVHNNLNDMPWNVAKRAVEFFIYHSKLSKARYISFYGGEPLLRFDMIKRVIDYSRKLDPNVRFSLSTNGVLLNKDNMKFMEKNNIDLQISLDGPKSIHNKYRKFPDGNGTFQIIKKNILNMKKFHPKLYDRLSINSVIVPTDFTINYINDFFKNSEIIRDLRPDNIMIKVINPDENLFYKKYSYSEFISDFYGQAAHIFKDYLLGKTNADSAILPSLILERNIKKIYFRSKKLLSDYLYFWPNGICIPGMRSLFVSSDGAFFPCEKFYDENDLSIGDIFRGFYFEEISKLIEDYCSLVVNFCRKCWAYRFCDDCLLSIRSKQGFDLLRKSQFCEAQRRSMVFYLILFVSILEDRYNAFEYLGNKSSISPNYVKLMIEHE